MSEFCDLALKLSAERVGSGSLRKLSSVLDEFSSKDFEVGFSVCRVDEEHRASDRLSVWRDGAFLPSCDRGEVVGSVHSHKVHEKSCVFSDVDWLTSLRNGLEFMCLLCNEGEGWKVKCVGLPERGSEEWENAIAEVEEVKEEVEAVEKESNLEGFLSELENRLRNIESKYAKWKCEKSI